MKKYPRFCRQFAKAWTEFHMVSPTDSILLPLDADIPHLSLCIATLSRINKMDSKAQLSIVYLHTETNINPEVKAILDQFSKIRKIAYFSRQISQPKDMNDFHRILTEVALKAKCNKIILTDSLDYIDSILLSNMCSVGSFIPVEMVEKTENATFIRPFCYLTDAEIMKFGEISKLADHAPSFVIPDDEIMAKSKEAIKLMTDDTNNIQMNFLHSQFHVKRKFIGVGEEGSDFMQDPF